VGAVLQSSSSPALFHFFWYALETSEKKTKPKLDKYVYGQITKYLSIARNGVMEGVGLWVQGRAGSEILGGCLRGVLGSTASA